MDSTGPATSATEVRLELPFPALFGADTLADLPRAVAAVTGRTGALHFGAPATDRADQALAVDAVPVELLHAQVPALSATSLEHDGYFGVRRIVADPAEAFVRSLIASHLDAPLDCVAQDTGGWDDSPQALFEGIASVFAAAGLEQPQPAAVDESSAPDPMTVWMAGHRLFFALEQGAVIGLRAATGARDEAGRTAGLRFASGFLRSSAAAMRLASAFDPQLYMDDIRPDMAPPKVSAGFSGLYTVDHKELVRAMLAWRGVAEQLPVSDAADELVDSVRTVYVSHEFVCERFRGGTVPSLRSEAAVDSSFQAPSGVALAREFTRRRVNSLRRTSRPGRRDASTTSREA